METAPARSPCDYCHCCCARRLSPEYQQDRPRGRMQRYEGFENALRAWLHCGCACCFGGMRRREQCCGTSERAWPSAATALVMLRSAVDPEGPRRRLSTSFFARPRTDTPSTDCSQSPRRIPASSAGDPASGASTVHPAAHGSPSCSPTPTNCRWRYSRSTGSGRRRARRKSCREHNEFEQRAAPLSLIAGGNSTKEGNFLEVRRRGAASG